MAGEIDGKYQSLGSNAAKLGQPAGPEQQCADGTGRFRDYESGTIIFHPDFGVFVIWGSIYPKWKSLGREKKCSRISDRGRDSGLLLAVLEPNVRIGHDLCSWQRRHARNPWRCF